MTTAHTKRDRLAAQVPFAARRGGHGSEPFHSPVLSALLRWSLPGNVETCCWPKTEEGMWKQVMLGMGAVVPDAAFER